MSNNLTFKILFLGEKYEPEEFVTEKYKTRMKLTIISVTAEDYGTYKCLSRNALGDTDGTIKIYRKFCDFFKCLW